MMLMKYRGRTYRPRSMVAPLFATMLLYHGCTPVFEKSVTIHFQDKAYTLHFTALAWKVHSSRKNVVHLVDVLERLEAGEEVDLSARVEKHCCIQRYDIAATNLTWRSFCITYCSAVRMSTSLLPPLAVQLPPCMPYVQMMCRSVLLLRKKFG